MMISKIIILIPEVVLDGEHAVLGAAVDGGVAEGRGDAALLQTVLPQSLGHTGSHGGHVTDIHNIVHAWGHLEV